jgi:hypothetical protein
MFSFFFVTYDDFNLLKTLSGNILHILSSQSEESETTKNLAFELLFKISFT